MENTKVKMQSLPVNLHYNNLQSFLFMASLKTTTRLGKFPGGMTILIGYNQYANGIGPITGQKRCNHILSGFPHILLDGWDNYTRLTHVRTHWHRPD